MHDHIKKLERIRGELTELSEAMREGRDASTDAFNAWGAVGQAHTYVSIAIDKARAVAGVFRQADRTNDPND